MSRIFCLILHFYDHFGNYGWPFWPGTIMLSQQCNIISSIAFLKRDCQLYADPLITGNDYQISTFIWKAFSFITR